MSHVFTGTIENGHLDQDTREKIAKALQKYTRVVITLEERKTTRTIQQDRYYWLYLTVIAGDTGDTPEDLHSFFKDKFCPRKWIKVKGKAYEKVKSTTELTKQEFSDYLDRICALTDIPLPDKIAAGYLPT